MYFNGLVILVVLLVVATECFTTEKEYFADRDVISEMIRKRRQSSLGRPQPPRVDAGIVTRLPPSLSCRCPFTPQYMPVCGSDAQTYVNEGLVRCFQYCGYDVSVVRQSACTQQAGRAFNQPLRNGLQL